MPQPSCFDGWARRRPSRSHSARSRRSSAGSGPSRKAHGLAIGLLTGVAAGAAIGYAGGQDCTPGEWLCFSRGTTAAGGAIALGLVGAAVGALVAPGEKWEATTTERLRLAVGPGPAGGVGARLTVRF